MLKYLQQTYQSSLPVQPPPSQPDAIADVSTASDIGTNKTARQVSKRPLELARPGGAKSESGSAFGNNTFNIGNARNHPGSNRSEQMTWLPFATSQFHSVFTLEHVHQQLMMLPANSRSDALLEIAANVQFVPASMRGYVFDYLCNQIHDVQSHHRCAYISEMAQALGSLPSDDARSGIWAVMAKSLKSIAGQDTLEPTIALIDAIRHVAHHAIRSEHLSLLTPVIIEAELPARNIMTGRLIKALPHVAAGNNRANVIEQIRLLLLQEKNPTVLSTHLHSLIAQSRSFTPADNLVHFLEQIAAFAWNLPRAERCKLLTAIPKEFSQWNDTRSLKAATLIISRQAQLASAEVQDQLAVSVGAGLSNVMDQLVKNIDRGIVADNTAANLDGWLQAAAFAFGPVREPVSKAAACLVELAWSKNHPAKEVMLESYGNAFSVIARKQLELKLGIAT